MQATLVVTKSFLATDPSENRSWTSRSGTSHKSVWDVWAQRLPQCAVPMLLRLGLPEDIEAKELWLRHLPESRVLPFGKKDLFLAKVGVSRKYMKIQEILTEAIARVNGKV